MGNRAYSRFPWYSPKRVYGSMPNWRKRYRAHQIRQQVREALAHCKPMPLIKNDDSWM